MGFAALALKSRNRLRGLVIQFVTVPVGPDSEAGFKCFEPGVSLLDSVTEDLDLAGQQLDGGWHGVGFLTAFDLYPCPSLPRRKGRSSVHAFAVSRNCRKRKAGRQSELSTGADAVTAQDLGTRALTARNLAVVAFKKTSGGTAIDAESAGKCRAMGLALLWETVGQQHPYYRDFDAQTEQLSGSGYARACGILDAVQEHFKSGWLTETKALIRADVFSDFLEMAQYFIEEGHKIPAAVLAGAALESHLRALCAKAGLPIEKTTPTGESRPLKAEQLNQDLRRADTYDLTDQKQITGWLDIRNNAAHGHADKVREELVEAMIPNIRAFMKRAPA
jgi:hypothetical protein